MGLLEPWHIIVILVIILLLFGGKKIPELMKGLGKGMKEFKDAQNGENNPTNTPPPPPSNTNTNSYTAPGDKPRV
jgi:sec-independent protein translocase protein TatA